MKNIKFAELDWPQKLTWLNEYDNFARLYGIRLVEYYWDYACLEMQLTPMYLNSQGRVHGSWQAALIMIGAGKAARSRGQEVRPCKLNMNYHHGVQEGLLRVIARVKQYGPQLICCDVEVHCWGDHSVNGDHDSRQQVSKDILVASGRVDFLPLPDVAVFEQMPSLAQRQEFFPEKRRQARPLPVYPESRAGLHDEVPGLRPCFKESDWPGKRTYMNENENFYYNEDMCVTEYGPGHAKAEMPVWPQHVDAGGWLDPAWLVILLDPLIGKPSLHTGHFCVTAQSSITFFEPRAQLGGRLFGEAGELSRKPPFAVYAGSVWDEQGQELAYGVCTMYLRSTEINFRRELPL